MEIFRSYNSKSSPDSQNNAADPVPSSVDPTTNDNSAVSGGSDKLGVVPQISFIPGVNVNALGRGVRLGARIYNQVKSGDVQGAMDTITSDETSRFIQDAGGNFKVGRKVRRITPTGGGGGGDDTGGGSFSNIGLNHNRLSLEPDPVESRLDTGIVPHTFTDDFEEDDEFYDSPLHLNFIRIRVPTSETSGDLLGYFTNRAVMTDFLNVIQRNITFAIDMNILTTVNIIGAYNKVIKALQVYYEVSRLLVYYGEARNKNVAILELRESLIAQYIDDWLVLKRLLDGIPIPPNLNDLVYYIMQFYRASTLPSSPVISFSGIPISEETNMPDWGIINECITELNSITPNYRYVFQVIGRAIPAWYQTRLKTGIDLPKHDPNFVTMWTNSPYEFSFDDDVRKGPLAPDNDAGVLYNTWENNLDGWAFSFMAAFNNGQGKWFPSLVEPIAFNTSEGVTSKLSWYTFSGTSPWSIPCKQPFLLAARCETYNVNAVGTIYDYAANFIATQKCRIVSVRTIAQSSKSLIDWMFNFANVNIRVDNSIASGLPLSGTRSRQPSDPNNRAAYSKSGGGMRKGRRSKKNFSSKMKGKDKDKE